MTRTDAERRLKSLFKFDRFYDDQWETISKLFNGERLLLIEKTGFGKSLCYQFPATQFKGLTVIFSPLIALMRDQVNYLKSIGVKAACVNSEQGQDENSRILEEAKNGRLKILYIAPERQENRDWLEAVRFMDLSMVVIDEAHCISVWGHDFRPAFRRIINLVKLMPQNFPVLATTATATDLVAKDIMNQMGENISLIRGNLLRDNFSLNVVILKNEDEKMVWLAEYLSGVDGNGLVYTGTRVTTETLSAWLQFNQIEAINYNAGLDTISRQIVEEGLHSNRWKCVVSTNALGMGFDKQDIRFIIHSQIPQSPVHYYQEIGRAGRDGKPTQLFLLFCPGDLDLPTHFIKNSRPALKKYNNVLDALKEAPLGEWDLMRTTNLPQTPIRVIKADLLDQGIIKEVLYGKNKKYEYQFSAPELNTKSFEELRDFKLHELDQMYEYVGLKSCRMEYLCTYLGDPNGTRCGKCDNDMNQIHQVNMDSYWLSKIESFKNSYFPGLVVESKTSVIINGVAASYYGRSNVGATIHRCKYENGGDYPDYLLKLTLRAYQHKFGDIKFDLIFYVPPTESGDLVKNFAEKISRVLNVPISHNLNKTRATNPQKIFNNTVLKRDNVNGAFSYEPIQGVTGKNILLIDDIFDSGATIREIGKYLTKLGASLIAPLVIAKTVGGDIA
ncbi:MAG: RecQ family ATP-dependent DNA helicase [Calditrichaceae bacterium]